MLTARSYQDIIAPEPRECPECLHAEYLARLIATEMRDYAKQWPLCSELTDQLEEWAIALEDMK